MSADVGTSSPGMASVASIVVLPSHDWPERPTVLAGLRALGPVIVDVDLPAADAAPLSVRTCAAVRAADPPTPILVVAHGGGAALLPAVALAPRTAHRAIGGYALLEPDADPSAQDWPDAPVLVIAPGDWPRARLRGWELVVADGPSAVVDAIGALATR